MSSSGDRAAVEAAISEWNEAVNANDPVRFFAVVSGDMEMIPPGESPVRGKDAHEMLNGFFEGFDLGLDGKTPELTIADDLAVRRYQYELTLTPKSGGDPEVMKGQGIHILKRRVRWEVAVREGHVELSSFLREAVGCSLAWAKLWVAHRGVPRGRGAAIRTVPTLW